MKNSMRTLILASAISFASNKTQSAEPPACPACKADFDEKSRQNFKKLGKDFTLEGLIDQNGRTLKDSDFLGKPIIIQWGFTNCTMVCSKAMQALTESVSQFPENETTHEKPITLLFIATKPNETAETMKTFLAKYPDVGALGIAGPKDKLEALWKSDLKILAPNGTHTPYSYFINGKGELLELIAPLKREGQNLKPAPENITAGIQKHFKLETAKPEPDVIKNRGASPRPGL